MLADEHDGNDALKRTKLISDFMWQALSEDVGFPRETIDAVDSVDDQIDSILLRYESDCIVSVDQGMVEGLIRELAKDEEPEESSAKKPELGEPDDEQKEKDLAAGTADKDDQIPDVEADPLMPKIDLKMFAGKVARLAINHEALLDIDKAIAGRAANYLRQNYNDTIADEFCEIMEDDYDIKLKRAATSEPREIPQAVGASAAGLG